MGAVPHCPAHREGDAKTGVKGKKEKEREKRGRAKSDVKSEIIINDSHERRMLDLHEKIDGHEKGDARSLGQFAPRCNPFPFLIPRTFIFANRNSRSLAYLSSLDASLPGENVHVATSRGKSLGRELSREASLLNKQPAK